MDITRSGEGSYEQLLRFLSFLERSESFVRVNSLTCTARGKLADDGGQLLTVAFNISTFRFDDDVR